MRNLIGNIIGNWIPQAILCIVVFAAAYNLASWLGEWEVDTVSDTLLFVAPGNTMDREFINYCEYTTWITDECVESKWYDVYN